MQDEKERLRNKKAASARQEMKYKQMIEGGPVNTWSATHLPYGAEPVKRAGDAKEDELIGHIISETE